MNPLHLKIGDMVLLKNEAREKNQKPYAITRNWVNSTVKINSSLKEFHNNYVKPNNPNMK